MKSTLLLLVALLCGISARSNAQSDSTPAPGVWIRAHTPATGNTRIFYLSQDTCWAIGDGLLLSTDAGMNWHIVPCPNAGTFAVAFSDKRHGFIFPDPPSVSLRTTDGGTTWDTIPSPMQRPSAVATIDSLRLFVSGRDGIIARTTDAGKTWKETVVSSPSLHAIAFADSLTGYAVGAYQAGPDPSQFGGGCFKTTNGGESWMQVYTGIKDDATGVATVTPNIVLTVGPPDTVYRTTDGGVSWMAIATPVHNSIIAYDDVVAKGQIGYVSGGHGTILRSEDTGKTWSIEPTNIGIHTLRSPRMYGDSLAAVGSDGGIILIRKPQGAGVAWANGRSTIEATVHPNPAYTSFSLHYALRQPQRISIVLYSSLGNAIDSLVESQFESGEQTVQVSAAALPSGAYYIRILGETEVSEVCFSVQR